MGFCVGGHLAFRAALHREVRAASRFYPTDLPTGTLGEGKTADTLARVGERQAEIVMIWGRQDPHIPDEGRAATFMRDEGPRYDPQIARVAFGVALDLFARTF